MLTNFPWLSVITFLPLVGAIFIMLFTRNEHQDSSAMNHNIRNVSLWVTTVTFLVSLVLLFGFSANTSDFQFIESHTWIEGYGIGYHLGIDGISLFFILLTTLLMPICILAGWESITVQVREYMVAFLLLETLVIGTFASLDFLLFYFFFEGSLIPMFLIIGIWGGDNRVYAAFKFFLYTLAGSVLLLLALIFVYASFGTTFIPDLMMMIPSLPKEVKLLLWLAFFASFAVKVPMWPFHTWLPDAHVQAPTAGSVILAGVLLKLGAYGFLRFSLPMLPDISVMMSPLIYGLSVIAVIYTSLVALRQTDMKKLIAYSSVAHMGFVTVGIFTFTIQGIEGAIFQMVSHGLVSGALFLCVGALYDRLHTKQISLFGGVANVMPRFALIFMTFTMAAVGLPGTSGFVGEFLILLGAFKDNVYIAALTATGVILGAAYMLWLYRRVMFGEVVRDTVKVISDISSREFFMFLPLLLLVVLLGIFPNLMLSIVHESITHLMGQISMGAGL